MARRAPSPRPHARRTGFTLVELLVAISILSLIAIASWRGLDAMARAQQYTRSHSDEALVLQAALAQWGADLDALAPLAHTHALAWDGRLLRLTRRDARAPEAGVVVVAWAQRAGADGSPQWQRWQSPPLHTRGQWQQAWQRAARWAQQPGADAQATPLLALQEWRLWFHQAGQWAPAPARPAEAADAPASPGTPPEGVRLQLVLPAGGAFSGALTRDWVSPLLGGSRS